MYILVAVALAISLFITAAPASKVSAAADDVKAEWERVGTPTAEDWVLAPDSTIIDYALAEAGDVAYAIVEGWNYEENPAAPKFGYWLLKSENGAATWTDITDALEKVRKTQNITELLLVATDWVDPDFVAVALTETDNTVRVFVSKDGGTTFKDANEVRDVRFFSNPNSISDLAVSFEGVDATRDIAISGRDDQGNAALFRSTVTGDIAGAWDDATDTVDYPGWDNVADADALNDFNSMLVTDIIFSPDWENDMTILAVTITSTITPLTVHLQTGTFGEGNGAWNKAAGLVAAVPVITGASLPMGLETQDARGIAGVTLPSDYSSTSVNTRYAWVWVNYIVPGPAGETGEIFRVKNALHTSVAEQIEGMPWLTNVSYWGTIAEGKAIAGVLGDGMGDYAEGCAGIQVWHKDGIKEMDICCPAWEEACKMPTGIGSMAVSYVSLDKAYGVALHGDPQAPDYDEGAWSVSVDGDGLIWNQLSLVDTFIDYLSDVAVSPNCNKRMLVTVNGYYDEGRQGWFEHGSGCDSVWLYAETLPEAEEYSGYWVRTFCFKLAGNNIDHFSPAHQQRGFLRLAPGEENGDTVYLVDRMTNTIYYNDMETWNCWVAKTTGNRISAIVDLAVKDEATIYALDYDGDVSMSDNYGATISWEKEVRSKVTHGWTIAVHGHNATEVLVGGQDGDVSYSETFADTFALLEKVSTIDGLVSVAFDTYYDDNNVVYAATALAKGDDDVYRWVIGEDDEWEHLNALPTVAQVGLDDEDFTDVDDIDFTGVVLGFKDGNLKTSAETGGVLYASYVVHDEGTVTGVARSLNPAEEIECLECVEWDYLYVGLDPNEYFIMGPQALKICGCMDPTTNTKLFAIAQGWGSYDMAEGEHQTVWTFEDCYAKKSPDVTLPTDNAIIPADPCSCYNAPFAINWGALCDACEYEIEFALDEDFTTRHDGIIQVPPVKGTPSYLVMGGEGQGAFGLSCEMTYYLRVRAWRAGTGQVIHSWWSDPVKITIAPSLGTAKIELVAPEPGALNVPAATVGFSWSLLADADTFDLVLKKGATQVASAPGLTAKYYEYTGNLTAGTTYNWQVTAYKDVDGTSTLVSRSDVGTFRTAAAPVVPVQDGVATPVWVWVVIAIGAVLVIVVIVLIFRTRRV
jgi:hypothetical protein